MSEARARILVIDDDEVVLTAIADLLEAAGYSVYTQTSPIGATSVIASEGIDLAIIDVNLPVMQGDNVIRLLRSWDKLKDLPIIVLSSESEQKLKQIQAELRTIHPVSKSMMQRLLVPTVENLLRSRTVSKPASARPQSRDADYRAKLIDQMAAQLPDVARLMRDIRGGSAEARLNLMKNVSMLRGQASLLGMEQVARLLGGIYGVAEALRPGSAYPASVDHAVDDGARALLALKRSTSGEFLLSPEPLISALNQALTSIPAGLHAR